MESSDRIEITSIESIVKTLLYVSGSSGTGTVNPVINGQTPSSVRRDREKNYELARPCGHEIPTDRDQVAVCGVDAVLKNLPDAKIQASAAGNLRCQRQCYRLRLKAGGREEKRRYSKPQSFGRQGNGREHGQEQNGNK